MSDFFHLASILHGFSMLLHVSEFLFEAVTAYRSHCVNLSPNWWILGSFLFWLLWIMLLGRCICNYLFKSLLPVLSEFLDGMVFLCFIFSGPAKVFSISSMLMTIHCMFYSYIWIIKSQHPPRCVWFTTILLIPKSHLAQGRCTTNIYQMNASIWYGPWPLGRGPRVQMNIQSITSKEERRLTSRRELRV